MRAEITIIQMQAPIMFPLYAIAAPTLQTTTESNSLNALVADSFFVGSLDGRNEFAMFCPNLGCMNLRSKGSN